MGQPPAMSNNSGLRARILSALVMIPVAVAIIWIGREVFLFFLVALGCFMSWEWSRISSAQSKTAWVLMAGFVGSALIILLVAWVVFSEQWVFLWLLPVLGYGFAWTGHFFFEKNTPATFKHPFYSLLGDWVMFKDMLLGNIKR